MTTIHVISCIGHDEPINNTGIAKKMNLSKCKAIFLIHLSDRNARENVFKNEVTRQVGKKCFVAKKNGGFI